MNKKLIQMMYLIQALEIRGLFLFERSDEYAATLRSMIKFPPWHVESVHWNNGYLEIGGWALAPQEDVDVVGFAVNDKPFDDVTYPLSRDDIAHEFWYMPNSSQCGFLCRIGISREDAFPAAFEFMNRRTGRAFCDGNLIFHPDPSDPLEVPDANRRRRVHGNWNEDSFRMEGYSNFMKLRQALRKIFNRDYCDFRKIIDWGCGCGRSTRYFRGLDCELTGVDIDNDNVQWCSQHLGFGRFLPIPLHPPTKLQASSFDLLIGISVFTHLKEGTQYEWLRELKRIASDGAVLLMSVRADTSICRANFPFHLFNKWAKRGFLDRGVNIDLLEINLEEDDYYRGIYHSKPYVMENWSKYFEIVDILPGYIGNNQDLVVMRNS